MNPLITVYPLIMLSFLFSSGSTCNQTEDVKETKGLQRLMELPPVLKECSGMIYLEKNTLLAHNDSGNKAELYAFAQDDTKNVRTIKVVNVKNHDWEDIASDEEFIYIGDTGNNSGTRQNLMIYKVKKADVLKADEVHAETISFSYAGQTRFNDSNRHNFDCEALVSKGDSLYLFSKNRGDFRTDVYALPKMPGKYSIAITGTYDVQGLITGADYRERNDHGELALVGYSVHGKALYPIIVFNTRVKGNDFFEGNIRRELFPESLQTESIVFAPSGELLISNEEEDDSDGYLYTYKIRD